MSNNQQELTQEELDLVLGGILSALTAMELTARAVPKVLQDKKLLRLGMRAGGLLLEAKNHVQAKLKP